MLQLIMNIHDMNNGQVEISTEVEDEDATDSELMALDEIIDSMDAMIDTVNNEDVRETTKNILSKIGKP